MKKQLFHLLREVNVSHDSNYDPVELSYTVRQLIVPTTFAVTWPNGTPCSLVEIYLIALFRRGASVREDGGSLRATVAKLSHLIRHCWDIKKDFWELDDNDFYNMVVFLMEEKKPNQPMVRMRDNNTVILIVAAAVKFLLWLQEEMLVSLKLIGVGPEYRIRLLESKQFIYHYNRNLVQNVYPKLPPRDKREPKKPISREKRNLLWQAVGTLSCVDLIPPRWAKGLNNTEILLSYLKARRELLLELLEATGARPGELSRLKVSANDDCYKNQELVLLTLKRRRHSERKIKLQPTVALRLTVFIKKYRELLLKNINESGAFSDPRDCVFLGLSGVPMSERSMVSEFSRLTKAAGLSDYQSCMSMFRHRFITKQVSIHLGIYLSDQNKAKELVTDSDYRTVLKKVATITGHGNESSLLHYIDLAWDELGNNDQVKKAVAIDFSLENSIIQVISLTGKMNVINKKSTDVLMQEVVEVLKRLQSEIKSAF